MLPDQHSHDLFKSAMHLVFDETIMKGMTINQLANRAGLSWGTVRNAMHYETKFPRFQTVIKLCRVINYDIVQSVRSGKKRRK